MLSTRYYRHYLWIFFYFFFILMGVAIAFDIKADASNSGTNSGTNSDKNLIRFLNVLFCFVFAFIGVVMQNYASRSLMGLNTFSFNRKKWLRRFLKLKRRKVKKVVKKRHVATLMFVNAFSNLVSLIPIYVICILILCGVFASIESTIFKKEFFCIAVIGKHAAWYLTLLISRFSMFLGKKRALILV